MVCKRFRKFRMDKFDVFSGFFVFFVICSTGMDKKHKPCTAEPCRAKTSVGAKYVSGRSPVSFDNIEEGFDHFRAVISADGFAPPAVAKGEVNLVGGLRP